MSAPNPEQPASTYSSASGKSRLLVVLLQCLPLLFVGGCVAGTFGPAAWTLNAPGAQIQFVFGLFIFAWGFGYAYLRQSQRFMLALCSGLVLALLAWWLNIVLLDGCIDLGTSQQCPQHVRLFDRPFAALTALVIGFWVVLYARDAYQLVTALGRGRSEEPAVGRSFIGQIAIASTVIGFVLLIFYVSPFCNQLWESTR